MSSYLGRYHISLVELLAACAEGKNVYTEIKCTSLLPLEDVIRVVTHEDCITEVTPTPLLLRPPVGGAIDERSLLLSPGGNAP